jgi:hypothetical protein
MSFNYLRQFRVSELKIDRSCIRQRQGDIQWDGSDDHESECHVDSDESADRGDHDAQRRRECEWSGEQRD